MSLCAAGSGGPGLPAGDVVTAQVALPRVRYGDDARARNSSPTCSRGCPDSRREGRRRDHVICRSAAAITRASSGSWATPSLRVRILRCPAGTMRLPAIFRPCASHDSGRDISDSDSAGRAESRDNRPVSWRASTSPKATPLAPGITNGIQIPGDPRKPDECTIVGVAGSVKNGNLAENNPVGCFTFPTGSTCREASTWCWRTGRDNPQLIARHPAHAAPGGPRSCRCSTSRGMPERLAASLRNQRAAMGCA